MSVLAVLRSRTRHSHDLVDQAFSAFDLGDTESYRAFLTAHCRALPVLEGMLSAWEGLPPIRPRTPLLTGDLAAMGEPMPVPLVYDGPRNEAAAWGMLYVVEGSRLGGGIMATRVIDSFPKSYLSALHEAGEWRAFGQALDAHAGKLGDGWTAGAIKGAEASFHLYRRAALMAGAKRDPLPQGS